jgi:hypothetical protein
LKAYAETVHGQLAHLEHIDDLASALPDHARATALDIMNGP